MRRVLGVAVTSPPLKMETVIKVYLVPSAANCPDGLLLACHASNLLYPVCDAPQER